jgi:hypothetical protein
MYGKLAVKTAKPWQNLVPNCEDVAVERVESIVMLDYRVSRPPRGILKNGPGKPTQPTADQKLNRVHNVVFFLNFVTPTLDQTGWWYTYPSEKYESQLGL